MPYEWRIDTQPPDTALTLHPQSLSNSDEAEFTFSGSDSGSGVASYECRRDGGSWTGCTSPQTYSSLAEGAHSFEVRALDTAGNADGSPAEFGWSVDTVAPQPQVDSLSQALLKAGESSDLEWHADENGSFGLRAGGTDCESGAVIDSAPYAGAPAPHTSEVKASDLAEGANTLRLCVTDAAGNRGQATATIDKDTEAPDTAITVHPQSLSNSDQAEFTFSGSDTGSGVASYECRKDGGSWSGCASPREYSSLAEGAHSFEVRAIDTAGNADGSPAEFGWSVDTTPPAVGIDSGPAGLTNDATPTFAFHAGEAGAAVECSIDTGTPDFGPCTEEGSQTPEGPLSDGPHTFRVRSTDPAGNQATATRDFTLDATSPETTLGAHPQALVASDEAEFTFSGEDPGGSGVAGFECRRDGGSWTGCTSPQTYSSLAEGAHSFEVRALDTAGNADGSPAEFGWSVDTEAPDTAITVHPQSLSNSDEAEFTFSGSDSGSGVASYECRRDGGSWTGCTSPQTYSSLAEGAHSFEVRALDTAGNADGSPAEFGWSVDTTPPAVGIDSGPAGLTNDATPTFAFHAGEAGAAVECSIDTGTPDFGPCTEEGSQTPEGPLSDGPHTFRVRSTDPAGNQATATRDFEVDTSLPQAPELTATVPASPASENHPKIEGSAPAGTTVKLFASIDCSGSPIATVTPAQLEAGIEVSVPDDSSTSFSATATSAADNASGCSEPISYVEDSSAPDTQITLHPQSLSNSDQAEFTFSGSDSGSGVASYECRRDGGSWTGCASPFEYSSLAEGAHSFEVRALDTAGNADGSPAEFGWSVDTVAPQPQVDSLSQALLKAGESSDLEWHADENGSFGLRAGGTDCESGAVIDSAPYAGAPAPHTSEVKASDLAEGANTLRLCVTDAAGNRGQATATIDKDTEAPDTAITVHPQSLSNSDQAEFTFSGSDSGSGVASYECRKDGGSWSGCASPREYSSLAEGAHSFEVRALDTAGNADGSPAEFGWSVDTEAPDTAITLHPQSLSNSDQAEFTFSGSDTGSGVASYECRKDGGAWSGCASPREYSSLAEGAHSFEVRALDTAGNADGSPAEFGWSVDTEAPDTAIATHPASLASSDEAEFTFTGSDTGSGVASYECRRDGGSWTGCTSPQTYSSLAEGAHSFEVRALDTAGNADGSPAEFGWSVDTEAPDASISSHPATVSTSADASFGFSADDGSGSGVASFQCRRDSAEPGDWESCGSPKTYKALAEGAHSFEVRAIDKAGNVAESPATFGWTIDTVAPDTAIATHPASLASSDEAEFTFTGSDSGSGVAGYECRKDGGAWTGCTSPQTYSSLAEGAHSFEVRALDTAGNADGSPAEFGWSVDTEAPDTAITVHPQSLSNSDQAEFTFSGSDTGSGVASYECRKDGGSWSGCASPREYSSLAEGAHSFEVRALDTAGNADGSPAEFGWSVDTTPPAVGIDSGPAGLTNDATPTFAFHAGEAGAAVECSIDTGTPDFGPCTEEGSQTPEGPLSDGPHTFRVRSTDPAGNQATATRDFEVDTSLPQAPELTATVPASPASENHPKIEGSAPAGTTVKLFASIDCSGSPIATVTPAQLEAGIEVSVPDDSSTSFSATATSAADNASGCSEPISYVEDSSAPDTQITLHPQSLSNSDQAEFTFSGSDTGSGVASYECRRDGGAWTGCTSPQTYSSLAEGAHSFEVRALDTAGNADGSPAEFGWSVDTEAPDTAITLHPQSLSNSDEAEFTFSGSDTGSGVASYECRKDGGSWSGCASPREYSSLAEGAHSFEVRALDTAGNADGSPAEFGWSVDTEAPDTALTLHPQSLSNSDEAEFTFSGSDTGSGVASYECRKDGGSWSGCASPREYSSLAEGAHSFEVRALDTAGNADGSPAEFGWSVDTTPPAVGIDSGPAGLTNDATPTFAFHAGEAGAAVECSIDTGTPDFGPCTEEGSQTPEGPLSDGPHTFRVRSTDPAGNQATATRDFEVDTSLPQAPELTATVPASPASENHPKIEGSAPAGTTVKLFASIDCSGSPIATVTPAQLEAGIEVSVPDDSSTSFSATATSAADNASGCSEPISYVEDSSAPDTQITLHPQSLSNSDQAEFTFSGSDTGSGVASYECRRDGGAWTGCTSPQTYSSLAEGAHSFEVRALDTAGNADGSPAEFGWSVDTTSPVVQIDSGPSGLTNDPTPTFTFSSEPGASFECSIDTGAPDFGPCSGAGSDTPSSPLANGSYTFRVLATDAAANQAISRRDFEVDTSAPSAPHLTATAPASPANDNNPQVIGSAPAGTTVKLYATIDCSGEPLSVGSAAELEAGIAVLVPDDSTTAVRATATTAADNISGCSEPVSYVEDSSAPQTTIDSHPASLNDSPDAEFTFSGSDSGAGVSFYQCHIDDGSWSTCASPREYTGLSDGAHTFEARAVDRAGNVDGSPASFTWAIDTSPAEPSQPSSSEQTQSSTEASQPPTLAPKVLPEQAELLRVLRRPKNGTALLLFKVPAPGTLSAQTPAISLSRTNRRRRTAERIRQLRLRQRRIKPLSIRVTHPGRAKVPIVLTPAGKRLLARTHRLKVRVVVRYSAAGGAKKATWKITVTLKKRVVRSVTESRHKKRRSRR